MRLTVVALVAVSLVGMSLAAGAARAQNASGSMLVPRPVMFDDQVVPTSCGCGGPQQVIEPSCGCQGTPSCGCGSCGGESCGGCGGDDCCDDCCGLLNDCCHVGVRFRAEALPMMRTAINRNIVFPPTGTATANDFSLRFPFEWGGRVAAEIRVGCDDSVEVVYTGFQHWHDEATFADVVTTDTATYSADYQSGEINYWKPVLPCSRFINGSLMFGGRWMHMPERFTFTSVVPTVLTDVFESNTRNELIGPQLGWVVSACAVHGLSLRWDGKACTAANLVEQTTTDTQNPPAAPTATSSRKDVGFAFVGDTSLVARYEFGPHLSVHAGYYLMWAEGLALAPEQLPVFPNVTPRNDVVHDGHAFFQGAIAGVEATF